MPTTVITDEMITAIGARNLQDVLVAYVPGITVSQDHNEVNVAMRGVFASSQQKILILVDGHVLNSRALQAANPDFSISLDKIKRIEVLRGPGSSQYGGGALAAVVNIFTKTAADLDGTTISAGAGNFGHVKLSGLYGAKTEARGEVVAWGTFYQSDGEGIDVPASQDYSRRPANARAILDGFRGPASHDVGLTLKTDAFTLYAAHRLGKYTEPFSAGGATGESYSYADYQAWNGVGPGLAMGGFNLDISHEQTLSPKTSVTVRGYFDRPELTAHLVTDPSQKAHTVVSWTEWDAGAVVEVRGSYSTASGRGSWQAGTQVDVMRVTDSTLASGTGGTWTSSGSLMDLGEEKTYSGFARMTHPVGQRWAASAGGRFDLKVRHEGDNINTFSPSLALSFIPNTRSSVSVSYAEAFADAPYFYRYNVLPSYRGARTLKPEYLRSVQITPSVTLPGRVTARMNVFYNDLSDLIWRNNNAGPTEPIYQNAGFLKSWGVEEELGYTRGAFNVSGNVTYQRASSARNYDVLGHAINNVPNWTWNAILNVRPPAMAAHDVSFNLSTRDIGSQRSPINITVGTTTFREPDRTIAAVAVVNAGARIGRLWSTRAFVDTRVYNLFDTAFEQGGSVPHPYPQAGRSGMVSAGMRF